MGFNVLKIIIASHMANKYLTYYVYLFEHLTVNRMRGQVAPHKPLLLLAIMDLIEDYVIQSPKIELSEALMTAFKWNYDFYALNITHFKPVIGTPYYHMSNEPFWKLVPKEPDIRPRTTAISSLRSYYKYAEIDQELFNQMSDPAARLHLRKVLIKTYLEQ